MSGLFLPKTCSERDRTQRQRDGGKNGKQINRDQNGKDGALGEQILIPHSLRVVLGTLLGIQNPLLSHQW